MTTATFNYAITRNGEQIATVTAENYAHAYDILATMCTDADAVDVDTITDTDADTDTADADTAARYRVHLIPDTDYTALLVPIQIARRNITLTVARTGGTPTLRAIYYSLTGLLIDTYRQAQPSTEWLFERMADIDADAAEYIGLASKGLYEAIAGGYGIAEQYRAAHLAINAYMHSQRGQTDNEKSLEYIITGGGDIVTVNQYIGRILSGKDAYYPAESYGTMDAETAAHLGETISAACRMLTPRQLDIVRLTAKGYSTRGIMEQLHVKSSGTIDAHLAIIRGKIADYIEQNAPQYMTLIHDAAVKAARQARNADRHTAESKARARATQAARAKAYRERKKAERENAEHMEYIRTRIHNVQTMRKHVDRLRAERGITGNND